MPVCPQASAFRVRNLQSVLALLSEDAFHPQLKTHKLKGKLIGLWACSAGYDLRVVFEFVKHKGEEAILLQSVGTTKFIVLLCT